MRHSQAHGVVRIMVSTFSWTCPETQGRPSLAMSVLFNLVSLAMAGESLTGPVEALSFSLGNLDLEIEIVLERH